MKGREKQKHRTTISREALVMKKNKPTDIDWETIENEYRAGMLSIREVARRNGVDHAYLIRTAKKKGWSRDLTD